VNFESMSQIIQIAGGSTFIGIITLIINQINKKHEESSKTTDDRIDAWQKIANENKNRIKQTEDRLALYERYSLDLQTHITNLEQLLVRLNPGIKLPKRPGFPKSRNSEGSDRKGNIYQE